MSGGGDAGGGTPPERPGARSTMRPANKRGVARLAAVQALYQMDVAGISAADVVEEFELFRLRQEIDGEALREADADWLRTVVTGVVDSQRDIDRRVDQSLAATWPLARIDLTLRAVLRAATFELEKRADVPAAVVISEYLDVARAFFDGDEPGIVNAVLDRIAREVRPGELAERAPGGPRRGPRDAP